MKKLIITFVLLTSTLALAETDAERKRHSLQMFDKAAQVFMHPRCLNCHPAGDAPTQGMDMHVHQMNVKRGKDDHGAVAMKCATCHQTHNNEDSGVPGAPTWALAPKSMAWQGLSKRELCLALKDPKKTHKTMDEMIEHNAHDKLVAWGWNPGKGRQPVPFTQEEFGYYFEQWVKSGAACPE